MIIPLLIFIASAILLFFTSNQLLKLIMRRFHSVNLLFFLLLPGVLLHELSHLIAAQFLQVRTGELSLKPSFQGGHLQLGSAQIALTDPFRLTLIGTAPFMVGTTILWLLMVMVLGLDLTRLSFASLSQISTLPTLHLIITGYFVFAISNTMFSSPSDLQSATLPLILILLFLAIAQFSGWQISPLLSQFFANLFSTLSLMFFIVLMFNFILLFLLRLVSKHH